LEKTFTFRIFIYNQNNAEVYCIFKMTTLPIFAYVGIICWHFGEIASLLLLARLHIV